MGPCGVSSCGAKAPMSALAPAPAPRPRLLRFTPLPFRRSYLSYVLVPGRASGSDSRDSHESSIALDQTRLQQRHLEQVWSVDAHAVEGTPSGQEQVHALLESSQVQERGVTDIHAQPSTSPASLHVDAGTPGHSQLHVPAVSASAGGMHPSTPPSADASYAAMLSSSTSASPASSPSSSTNSSSKDRELDQEPPHSPSASSSTGTVSIPQPVWVISCISASLTLASCVFNTALPIYMVSELKMSMASMGMFEGILEAFSYIVRMFSGVVSDLMTSRKAAITLGFALGAAAKFGMASAVTVPILFASKAADRLANGVQAAPRDALIGDLSPPGARSACFGLAQSLRKWGSMVGALLCFFLMKASNNNYKMIFFAAASVSLLSTFAFIFLVPAHVRPQTPRVPAPQQQQEQQQPLASTDSAAMLTQPLLEPSASSTSSSPAPAALAAAQQQQGAAAPAQGAGFSLKQFMKDVTSMGADYYRMLSVICLYALGHINESLLEARAIEVGFGKAECTLVIAALCGVTFLVAYPLGRLDDKYGARVTFGVGMTALIAGHLTMLLSGTYPMAVFGACIFLGIHWAVFQGPLLSIMVGLAPPHLKGTAFGIFYTVMALTALMSGRVYGSVWHAMGANAAFSLSAGFMAAALLALPWLLPKSAGKRQEPPPPAAQLQAATA